ncbi:MAG TPA: terminase small subunit [Stellaceae bacterium]|nr:terminase small subunit [Stellaceae bacterium]
MSDPFDVRRLFAPPEDAEPEPAPAEPVPSELGQAELMPPLKERHRRFVLEYIIDLNGRAAAIRAGYARGKAGGRASELLRRPEVQLAIREEMKEREKRLRLSGDRIIEEAMRIAFVDPGRIARWGPEGVELIDSDDLTAEDRAAVKWISVGGRKGARAQRFEMHDKLAALALLARMTGMITREPGRGRFAILAKTPDELAADQARREKTMAKLQRLVDAKAAALADAKFKAMQADDAARKAREEEKEEKEETEAVAAAGAMPKE